MEQGTSEILSASIAGIFAYAIARLQARREIAQLKEAAIRATVLERDFEPLLGWLRLVETIISSGTTVELRNYIRTAEVHSAVVLLDIRYKLAWIDRVKHFEGRIMDHRTKNTRPDEEVRNMFYRFCQEVLWIYEKQRGCLRANAIRRLGWRVTTVLRRLRKG